MDSLSLGQKLKKARLEKNFTQQDVAGDFITRNMLSKIENDLAKPSIKTIEYLAKRLDKPVSYLLESIVEGIKENEESLSVVRDSYELIFEHSCYLIKDNEYDKCISYLEDMITHNQGNISSFYYSRILYNLALCFFKKKYYETAMNKFEQVSIFMIENKDYYYLSNLYFHLHNIYYFQNNFFKSETYGKKAIEYLHKSFIDDVLYEIKLYFKLSFPYKRLGKYTVAIESLTKALDLSKEYNCHYNSGEIHMMMGTILHKTKRYVEAIFHAKKAIEFFKFAESHKLMALTQRNLGNSLININSYDEAITYIEQSLQYFTGINDINESNTSKCDLLQCLVKKELYQDAIDYFEDIGLEALSKADLGNTYNFLGKAYYGLKDLSNAKNFLLKSEEILLSIKRYDYLTDVYSSLAQLCSDIQEYKEAYEYSTKAKEAMEQAIDTGLIYSEG